MTFCPTCNDMGRVYSCDWWPGCGCPPGATVDGCNGTSRSCPDCAGLSGRTHQPSVGLPLFVDDEPFAPIPSVAEVFAGVLLLAVIALGALAFLLWLVT